MNEYPLMMYRSGSQMKWDGGLWDTLVVIDVAEHESAIADGWMSPAEAYAKANQPEAMQPPQLIESVDEISPPTREELETKAKELGIKFDGRWGDKRLSDAIEQALKG